MDQPVAIASSAEGRELGARSFGRSMEHFDLRCGERVQLRVVGPRYAGARWLTRADCDSEHPAKLLVAPRPAMLVVGCPPKGMTIQCTDCPGIDEDALFLPEHFPSVIMTGHSRRIELVLRAPGFCVERRRILLLPGRNELKVELTPLASACPQ